MACVCLLVIYGAYAFSGVALAIDSLEAGVSLTPQAHAGLLASVLLGYSVGATKYVAQSEPRWRTIDIVRSRWGGAIGLMVGVMVSVLTIENIRALEPDRRLLNAGEIALNLAFLALSWALGRAGCFAVISVLRPATIAAVDLFDLRPLYSHGRDQLRAALVWLTGASLFIAVMLFDPNPAVQVDSVKVVGPMLGANLVVAIAMILLPLRRVWASIRSAKATAIASLTADLRALHDLPQPPPGREADLLSRRTYFSELSEWPFDAASLGTFGFYVLLPFVTWLSATFAKRLFDTVFMEKVIKAISAAIVG